ncbi:MAG: bacillithiol biosynthesis BshC, partial [Flavobacteriales bacterium]
MRLQQFSDPYLRKLTPLVGDYCAGNPAVRNFYSTLPVADEIAEQVKNRVFTPDAFDVLHQTLSDQYAGLTIHQKVLENMKAIADHNAACVTTGHQLCILGGPAFMVYKILSTIKLASSIQAHVSDKKIVPVFWLASEDHDRDEINHVYVQQRHLEWNTQQTGAVGRFSNEGLSEVLHAYSEIAYDEASQRHIEFFRQLISENTTLAAATRAWVNACFGEWGVVVIDADDARLKRLFVST